MGTRTVRIIGKAYAESGQANLVASMNGTEVFNGPVTASTEAFEPWTQPVVTESDVLFEFEVDDTVHDTALPSVIQITDGSMLLVTYSVNKVNPDDLDEFVANWGIDVKTEIIIEGEPLIKDPAENTGTWHVILEDGQTASMNWNLRPLPAGVPGNM
jgi:hypothetical protein